MKRILVICSLIITVAVCQAFNVSDWNSYGNLRRTYSMPPEKWPKPFIDDAVEWKELGPLPESPLQPYRDSLKNLIELGKTLFFDPRLSGSGKISCGTCHQPELSWTDGKERSIGHNGAVNKRNSPTIQNSWYYKRLFWDGRATDLADQAFAPINSETEMHSEMPDVIRKLRSIKGYRDLFAFAFGEEGINPDKLAEAIATFEMSVISHRSRFDEFLEGNKKALNNSELRGLHLFRTKARCMNCHNGPMFSDNQFHKTGITFAYDDDGLYKVTHKDEDMRKFKTPSLRDVSKTGPWMHNGKMDDLGQIISRYNHAKFPPGESSELIKNLGLSSKEQESLLAFLKAISTDPVPFTKPNLPE